MKVAIDSGPLTSGHSVRGVGAYTGELIKSINQLSSNSLNQLVNKSVKRELDNSIKFEAVDFGKTDLRKYDVVHYPYFHPFQKTLPDRFFPRQKIVVTIHDLIQLIYPTIYQPGLKGQINFWKQKKLINRVDAIIVPTETSKKDVVRFLNVDPNKVYVIYEGVKMVYGKIVDGGLLRRIGNKYKLPKQFVLYVGDVNYNKNIPTLIKACLKINVPLVICGKQALEVADAGINLMNLEGPRDYFRFLFNIPHPELKHYFELSEEFDNNKDKIVRLGFVQDRDLAVIFNLASVYVQPSYYEGFGLPVLEAFASETPVVISKTNCLVEIAGDAALVADPKSVGQFADKINRLLKNRGTKEHLITKGRERLKKFSWDKAAEETTLVYKQVQVDSR